MTGKIEAIRDICIIIKLGFAWAFHTLRKRDGVDRCLSMLFQRNKEIIQ